ncbi:MAG: hypothetical protein PHR53_06335 [Bacteroidales bacterium]|nr:hypothetical protein [Bacteroidales bacterium]
MARMTPEEKHFLNLSGEYGVCSELAKQNIYSSLTYGNHKAADVVVFNHKTNKALVIEVKTTKSERFVTGFFQKYKNAKTPHPDFWVLVQIDKDNYSHYYVLTHEEIANIQMKRNGMTAWTSVEGVDNILLSQIKEFENRWDKIKLLS